MYELQSMKSVDYYSLILGDDPEEFGDLDALNNYRLRMGVYYKKFIEQMSKHLDDDRREKLTSWFEFNKNFIGLIRNSELVEELERILLNQ